MHADYTKCCRASPSPFPSLCNPSIKWGHGLEGMLHQSGKIFWERPHWCSWIRNIHTLTFGFCSSDVSLFYHMMTCFTQLKLNLKGNILTLTYSRDSTFTETYQACCSRLWSGSYLTVWELLFFKSLRCLLSVGHTCSFCLTDPVSLCKSALKTWEDLTRDGE